VILLHHGDIMITEAYKLYTHGRRNPTSDIDGYITISGGDINIETFVKKTLAITIKARLNNIYVQLSSDGAIYDDKILLEANEYNGDVLTVSFKCKSIKFTNVVTSGIADGTYQVIGWSDV